MGCDIHGLYEVQGTKEYWEEEWVDAGEFDPGRNYSLFAILANTRNSHGVPCINKDRVGDEECLENCSNQFRAWYREWNGDAHSLSYATLKEIKEYYKKYKDATVYNHHLVLARDETGKIISTCAATNAPNLGEVGECSIFGAFGSEYMDKIIDHMERLKTFHNAKDVRIIFFFDN